MPNSYFNQPYNGLTIYPTDVFMPIDRNRTIETFSDNTHAIHYHSNYYKSKQADIQRYNLSQWNREFLKSIFGNDIYKIDTTDINIQDFGFNSNYDYFV